MTEPPAAGGRLRLRAEDAEDLSVLAACLQDSLLPLADMAYLADEGRFVFVAGRFKWETASDGKRKGPFERVHCGVAFDGVRGVAFRGVDRGDRDRMHEILTIADAGPAADGRRYLELVLAGGGTIRLEVERILCHLEDLDESWPTVWRPRHPEGEA